MKLIFFDESKNDSDWPHYHIGGVCIDESSLRGIQSEIEQIARDVFGTTELSRGTEFHAVDIYHRKGKFRDWEPDLRMALFERLIRILSREEVDLIEIQINCQEFYAAIEPDEQAFMFLCERANDFVRARKSVGMLIGDRENDRIADRYAVNLSGYQIDSTKYEYGRQIDSLVDSVHFTHSHLSRFLQLADIYVWLLQFRLRHQNSDNLRHKALLDIFKKDGIDLSPSKHKRWPVTG